MGKVQKAGEKASKTFLKRMTAGSRNITVVVPFANDDVPKYLDMLEKFENKPTTRLIVVK